jgi:hypothetical protein
MTGIVPRCVNNFIIKKNHMKKQFYFLIFLLSGFSTIAQSPGGIAGAVLWLKANTGASPAAWTDNSGLSNNFSQVTPGNQPSLANNSFNYYPALQFNGTSTFLTQPAPTNFPTANTNRTILVVANATQVTGYRWIMSYGNVGSIGGTCQVGNHVASLANDFYGADFETLNPYWNTVANANGALASFTLNAGTGTQYDRGNFLQTQGFPALSAPSANAVIGALDGSPAELWSGAIGEVIMFNRPQPGRSLPGIKIRFYARHYRRSHQLYCIRWNYHLLGRLCHLSKRCFRYWYRQWNSTYPNAV